LKQLFPRAKKDKVQKVKEKDYWKNLKNTHEMNELKTKLVEKLILEGKAFLRVSKVFTMKNGIPKGSKFGQKVLKEIDYSQVDYFGLDEDRN
jgi:DNA-directed RNA polymerase subunit beta